MAKTLVIKGADFSTNKVTAVSFSGGNVPVSGLEIVGYKVDGKGVADSGNGLGYTNSNLQHGTIAAENGTLPLYIIGTSYQTPVYPIPIPSGATKIKITRANSDYYKANIDFFNSARASSVVPTSVELLKRVEQLLDDTPVEVNIENYTGFPNTDSLAISIERIGRVWNSEDFDNVTIEFVTE